MNICPACLKPMPCEQQPGDFLLCQRCGEFLYINDEFALVIAQPDELEGVTKTRLAVLLKARCAVLKQKISGQSRPDKPKEQR